MKQDLILLAGTFVVAASITASASHARVLIDDFSGGLQQVTNTHGHGITALNTSTGHDPNRVLGGGRRIAVSNYGDNADDLMTSLRVLQPEINEAGTATFTSNAATAGRFEFSYGDTIGTQLPNLNLDLSQVPGFEITLDESSATQAAFTIRVGGLTLDNNSGNGGLLGQQSFSMGTTGTLFIPLDVSATNPSFNPADVDELYFSFFGPDSPNFGLNDAEFVVSRIAIVPEPAAGALVLGGMTLLVRRRR